MSTIALAEALSTVADISTAIGALTKNLTAASQVIANAQAQGREITVDEWNAALVKDDIATDALDNAIKVRGG